MYLFMPLVTKPADSFGSMKRHPREDDAAGPTMKARKLDDSEAVKRKKKKRKTKKKKKKHARSSSSDTSSEDSSCSSDTSISSSEDEKRQKHREKIKKKIKKKEKKEKLKKKHKEEKKKQKSKNKSSPNRAENIEQTFCGPEVPPEILERSRNMAPMTQEEWEKRQSEVKRVLDTETGRYRLIKGDGEVLEEIVSKERHREINKQATAGDGTFFQSQIGWRIN